MASSRFRGTPAPYRIAWILILLVVCLDPRRAVSGTEFTDDESPPQLHDHAAWTISICPVLMSMTDLEDNNSQNSRSHLGASFTLSRRLSGTTLFDFGIQVTQPRHVKGAVPVYFVKFGPKFLARIVQKDRFFAGIGVAILSSDTPGKGSRWGGGPTLSMGMDYGVAHANCFYMEGTVGLAVITKKTYRPEFHDPDDPLPPDGPIGTDWENGAAWAQLALGMRFPL